MSEVKRYTIVECHNDEEFWAKMKEVKHGDYVLYSDYEELEQQKAELIEALRLSNNCINHAREYLKNKTDFRDNGLYKLRVISNEDLIKNIT